MAAPRRSARLERTPRSWTPRLVSPTSLLRFWLWRRATRTDAHWERLVHGCSNVASAWGTSALGVLRVLALGRDGADSWMRPDHCPVARGCSRSSLPIRPCWLAGRRRNCGDHRRRDSRQRPRRGGDLVCSTRAGNQSTAVRVFAPDATV